MLTRFIMVYMTNWISTCILIPAQHQNAQVFFFNNWVTEELNSSITVILSLNEWFWSFLIWLKWNGWLFQLKRYFKRYEKNIFCNKIIYTQYFLFKFCGHMYNGSVYKCANFQKATSIRTMWLLCTCFENFRSRFLISAFSGVWNFKWL